MQAHGNNPMVFASIPSYIYSFPFPSLRNHFPSSETLLKSLGMDHNSKRELSLSIEQTSTEAKQKYGFGRPPQEEGSTTRKKLKLSKEQLDVLDESFQMNSYPKLVWLIILFTYCFVILGVWLR